MKASHWTLLLFLAVLAGTGPPLPLGSAEAQPAATTPPGKGSARILANPRLWGRDLPLVLANLEAFAAAGEKQVALFPGQVVGTRRVLSATEAGAGAGRLNQAIEGLRARPTPFSQRRLRDLPDAARPFKASAVDFRLEDDSFHAAVTGLDLLAPGLTIKAVEAELGAPESVVSEALQTEGERRPVVLTLYRYAGGSIAFAESDMAAEPGRVDRVLLDVPTVITALQEEAP
ncbi:MAG TPA: hypothetical protein VF017_06810 [Thermoanaerobaculia bacterium]|nr:hypothetical protein [Thermoanaerobaculia bacterium]